MPKRKINTEDYELLKKKCKKLEDDLRSSRKREKQDSHRRRLRIYSSSSDSSLNSTDSQGLEETSSGVDDAGETTPRVIESPTPAESTPQAQPASTSHAGSAGTEVPTIEKLSEAAENNEVEPLKEPELDASVLEILGFDPTNVEKYGKEIQKDLAIRLEHNTTDGLSKETRKELLDRYLVPSNCKLLAAPTLNLELKAALTELVIKRDKAIESKQKVVSAAVSCLGQAISLVLSSKDKDTQLLRLLMDSARLLCDVQHSDTQTRRTYVITSIKREMKEPLQNAKADSLLFGQNFSDTLKAAKAINKSGYELKLAASPKPGPSKKFSQPGSSKNWKSNPPRKQATAAKDTTTATARTTRATTRYQRGSSSKTSHPQRTTHSRR